MTLAVLTPSFGPDLELCRDLVESVRQRFPSGTRHYLVVPREDVPRFEQLSADVVAEQDVLPRSLLRPPGAKYSVNLVRPFPPVRGWIRQQMIKLAVAEQLRVDTLVVVDSDIVFARPVEETTFRSGDRVRLFRVPAAVTGSPRWERHRYWHEGARRLLRMPPAAPPYDDYVSSLISWDPEVVRALRARVERGRRQGWLTQIGSQLHFSEWTLYGLFAREVLSPSDPPDTSADSLCHAYWPDEPLDLEGARRFVEGIGADDVAVMISAKSRTPLTVRREALRALLDAGG